jgi:hypothetical protein
MPRHAKETKEPKRDHSQNQYGDKMRLIAAFMAKVLEQQVQCWGEAEPEGKRLLQMITLFHCPFVESR